VGCAGLDEILFSFDALLYFEPRVYFIEGLSVESELPIKELMTSDVVTVDRGSSCVDAAERMLEHGIGGIIVTDDGRPVGILTEQDLVGKVILHDLRPSSVMVEAVMTSPLITVHSTELVSDVMRKMVRLRIRRFPVVEGKRLVGIVTDTDLLVVSVQMGEIFAELVEMSAERFPPVSADEWEVTGEGTGGLIVQGICEECGKLSENLAFSNGKYVCELCTDTD